MQPNVTTDSLRLPPFTGTFSSWNHGIGDMHHKTDTKNWKRLARIEWPTMAMLALCYGLWGTAGWLLFPAAPISALLIMAVCVALHSSLQHEVMHGHPTRNAMVNELLVFLPLGLAYPYRRYKVTHMQHHNDERLTDPYDDPESYYRTEQDWNDLPTWLKLVFKWNNTLLGRIILGPFLGVSGFIGSELKLVFNDSQIRNAWIFHRVGMVPLFVIVQYGFGIPFWLYALVPAYFGLSIIGVRTYCEHQWFENPNGRTIIVEKSILSVLFLFNNLHIVHHKLPMVPWYKLPALSADRKDEWQRLNGGYVFSNYLEIFRAYAFKTKEPNVHPVLYRGSEHAQAEVHSDERVTV